MVKLPEFTSVATKPFYASIGAAQSAIAGVQVLYPKVEAQVAELATKGKNLVAKLRDDSISGDVEILRDDAEVVVKDVD